MMRLQEDYSTNLEAAIENLMEVLWEEGYACSPLEMYFPADSDIPEGSIWTDCGEVLIRKDDEEE